MNLLSRLPHRRWMAIAATALTLSSLTGCTTTSLVLSAAGVATDTSMTWEIVKHLHAKATEGDPPMCLKLDSVERALSPRCGAFWPGSLLSADIAAADKRDECALTTAARDARLWPALPELIAKGAKVSACRQSPLVVLAQANDCPDLATTSPAVRGALIELAETDPRAVHHDVMRWLSCPASRVAGLDAALETWLAAGSLDRGRLAFSPLSALHPSDLDAPIASALEARGHSARDGIGGYVGLRASGFEEALRTSDWAALDWWLVRMPQLANRVPAQRADQLAWLPLDRVLVPTFLAEPATRADMVGFLLARGADPWQRLPANPGQSIAGKARAQRSPFADVLEAAAPSSVAVAAAAAVGPGTRLAGSLGALKLAGP